MFTCKSDKTRPFQLSILASILASIIASIIKSIKPSSNQAPSYIWLFLEPIVAHHQWVTARSWSYLSPCLALLLLCPLLTTPGYIFGSLPERCSAGQYGSTGGRWAPGVPVTASVPGGLGASRSGSPAVVWVSLSDSFSRPFPFPGTPSAGVSLPGPGERGMLDAGVRSVPSAEEMYLRNLHKPCKVSNGAMPWGGAGCCFSQTYSSLSSRRTM